MVGDAGVGVPVVQRQREGRASVVPQVVGDQVREDRVALHGIFGGVKVLKKRQAKTRTHFITDGQKQQTAAVLTKLSHGCGDGSCRREEQVGLPLALFAVEKTHGLARLERRDSALDVGFHARTVRTHLHEESYAFSLETNPSRPF